MKKNKGFTLVELLAVIVILAILLVIAVPNVISISQRIRKNMYCTKIEDIESAAKIYGNDNIDVLETSGGIMTVDVYTLVANNLFKKESNDCDNNKNNTKCVLDPRNNNPMDKDKITIRKKDKRVYAEYQSDKKSVCNE